MPVLDVSAPVRALAKRLASNDGVVRLRAEDVVNRICGIFPRINNQAIREAFLACMLETLSREWERIDNWRIDNCPSKKVDALNHLHDALFCKVLNENIREAAGLKIHMITVLSEEFPKLRLPTECLLHLFEKSIHLFIQLPRYVCYA
ncbi:unnamed protein product [Protopolystoma xenopodis]|uniref:Uncharacterized protein n=1 Tax=Protopolystoma xenopodis TaxID=117903 RepID=A0A448X9V9_9PLAT|nr:unnamed protein product [Protopolystoma xenopodis]